MRPEINGPKK